MAVFICKLLIKLIKKIITGFNTEALQEAKTWLDELRKCCANNTIALNSYGKALGSHGKALLNQRRFEKA